MDKAKQGNNASDTKKASNGKQQSAKSQAVAKNAKSSQVAKRPPQRVPVKVQKKGMGFSGVLNIILILLIALAAGAIYYADDLLQFDPTATAETSADVADVNDEIFLLEKQVYDQDEEITKAKEDAKAYETQIKSLEGEIVELEKKIEELENQAQGKVEYLEKVAKMYETMDTKKAIGILAKMEDTSDIIDILSNMDIEKASAILAGIKSTIAIEVTEEMLKELDKQ